MFIASLLILALLLFSPLQVAQSAQSALLMCLHSVAPSLFPFLAASKIVILSRDLRKSPKLFRPIAKFFNISPMGVWAFFLGLLCGYPIGAKTVCDLYLEQQLSKKEATLLLCFCNNAGPAFIIATVGGMFFNRASLGVFLYGCHVLAAVGMGFALRSFQPPTVLPPSLKETNEDLPTVVTAAISDAALTMLNITGVIVFFAAFFEGLRSLNLDFLFHSHPGAEGLFMGLFEFTSGIRLVSQSALSLRHQLSLTSFLLSFSGLSVFFQVMTFSAKLGLKITPCMICKVLTGFLAMILCFLLFPLFYS